MADKQSLDSHRRDFLKMAGMGVAALSFNPNVIESNAESLTSPVEKIVTEDATFYPNFEQHDDHPDLSQKIRSADNNPLVYFRECLVEPGFTRNTNYDILTSPYTTWIGPRANLGPILTSDETSALYEKKAFVSLENLVYDSKKISEDFERLDKDFNFYATATAVTTGFNLYNKLKGNEVTGKAVIENVASLLGLGGLLEFNCKKFQPNLTSCHLIIESMKLKMQLTISVHSYLIYILRIKLYFLEIFTGQEKCR